MLILRAILTKALWQSGDVTDCNSVYPGSIPGGASIISTTFPKTAQHCGLDNLSHFYREFKRHTGMTPAKYRREYHRDPVQPAD